MSALTRFYLAWSKEADRRDPHIEERAREFAEGIESWATHQIRFYCWDYRQAERVVGEARMLLAPPPLTPIDRDS